MTLGFPVTAYGQPGFLSQAAHISVEAELVCGERRGVACEPTALHARNKKPAQILPWMKCIDGKKGLKTTFGCLV